MDTATSPIGGMILVGIGLAAGVTGGYIGMTWRAKRGGDAARRTADVPDTADATASATEPTDMWPNALESLRTGVCVIDAEGRLLHANSGARALGAVEQDRLSSVPLRALVSQVRRSGLMRDTELEMGADGERVAVRVRLSPMPGDLVVVELTDISELHRVDRVRRDFVANVSHELKTPVGALQLLAEALEDAIDDPQAAARFTARIQHESARMSKLVTELLELSRLQGAEPLPEPAEVDVDRVVNEALDRGRIPADAKNITIRRTGADGLRVSGSETQLITALGNLVDNAVAYSPGGTGVTVSTAVADTDSGAGRMVTISVADQGIGIAAEDLDRIFERFYRADPARSRATGGTGLGLAIVKHIAVNHGGRVEVSSSPENGSVFTLMLPERPVMSDKSAPLQGAIEQPESETVRGRP